MSILIHISCRLCRKLSQVAELIRSSHWQPCYQPLLVVGAVSSARSSTVAAVVIYYYYIYMPLFQIFFVSLERKAILLYIKAVWRIEKNRGYELATVLNSSFCYELHSKNSRLWATSRSMAHCRLQRYNFNLK